jgi:ssDNA-binding Zn-finger/Zn-ribbon topoisomerase 1
MKLICGVCGADTVLKTGPNGSKFYGCSKYPACDGGTVSEQNYLAYTRNYRRENKEKPLEFDPGKDFYMEALSSRAKKVNKRVEIKNIIAARKIKKEYEPVVSIEKVKERIEELYPRSYCSLPNRENAEINLRQEFISTAEIDTTETSSETSLTTIISRSINRTTIDDYSVEEIRTIGNARICQIKDNPAAYLAIRHISTKAALAILEEQLGLSILSRIRPAHGSTKVKNLFYDLWPTEAELQQREQASRNISIATNWFIGITIRAICYDRSLIQVISSRTGLSRDQILERIDGLWGMGEEDITTLFSDYLPTNEEIHEVGNKKLIDIRPNDSNMIAKIIALPIEDVRIARIPDHVDRVTGTVRQVFQRYWPIEDLPATFQDPDEEVGSNH